MYECQLLCQEEYADRVRCARRIGQLDHGLFVPGMLWFAPWLWDHQDPDLEQYRMGLLKRSRTKNDTKLSLNYWRDWSLIRDPLMMMLPTGAVCLLDGIEAPVKGARIIGLPPDITISKRITDQHRNRFDVVEGVVRMMEARA